MVHLNSGLFLQHTHSTFDSSVCKDYTFILSFLVGMLYADALPMVLNALPLNINFPSLMKN